MEKDFTNLIALHGLAISYSGIGQKENMYEILERYDELFENSPSEQLLESWIKTINDLIQHDISNQQITTDLLYETRKLYEIGDLQAAVISLIKLSYFPGIEIDSMELRISALTRLESYDDALIAYDLTIEMYHDKIKSLRHMGQIYEANDKQKSLINLMFGKATLLINLEDYHKAHRVYLEILGIDKFDPDVYKKIAAYHEKYGQLRQALQNYEMALQLEQENDFLIEKIEELKKKVDE